MRVRVVSLFVASSILLGSCFTLLVLSPILSIGCSGLIDSSEILCSRGESLVLIWVFPLLV